MTRILMTSALALAALGTTAQAGALEDPVVEPAVQPVTMAPAPTMGGEWTGPYGGLSFGKLRAETGGTEEDGSVYGGFVGYDYDFGRFVAGGELDYQVTDDYDLGGVDVDNVLRLKLRGGYDLGRALVYATVGGARADTSIGDADGLVAGLGVDFKVTENFTVGAEYLAHQFDDIGDTNVDVDADTISLRGAYRF